MSEASDLQIARLQQRSLRSARQELSLGRSNRSMNDPKARTVEITCDRFSIVAIPVADGAQSAAGEVRLVHGAEMTEGRCANNPDVVEDALGESTARRLAAVISHAPGFLGDAFFGPKFERRHQGVLGQFLSDADIAELSGLQRPSDFVTIENVAGRHCCRAGELE